MRENRSPWSQPGLEGVPRSFTLNSNEILEALQEPLSGIVSAVMVALEQSPLELASDISERGNGADRWWCPAKDIDRLLMEETGIPVVVAEDPPLVSPVAVARHWS